jgi:hypothetical protein
LNFAVSGGNTFTESSRLEELGLRYTPNMVMIGYHGNNLENYTKVRDCQIGIAKKYYGLNVSKAENMIKLSSEQSDCVKSDWAEMSMYSTDELYRTRVEPYMENIHDMSSEKGFDVVVVTTFLDRPFPRDSVKSLEKITDRFGWELINFNGYIGNVTDGYNIDKYVLTGEDFHPNPLGHKMMADYIFTQINDTVSSYYESH